VPVVVTFARGRASREIGDYLRRRGSLSDFYRSNVEIICFAPTRGNVFFRQRRVTSPSTTQSILVRTYSRTASKDARIPRSIRPLLSAVDRATSRPMTTSSHAPASPSVVSAFRRPTVSEGLPATSRAPDQD